MSRASAWFLPPFLLACAQGSFDTLYLMFVGSLVLGYLASRCGIMMELLLNRMLILTKLSSHEPMQNSRFAMLGRRLLSNRCAQRRMRSRDIEAS